MALNIETTKKFNNKKLRILNTFPVSLALLFGTDSTVQLKNNISQRKFIGVIFDPKAITGFHLKLKKKKNTKN